MAVATLILLLAFTACNNESTPEPTPTPVAAPEPTQTPDTTPEPVYEESEAEDIQDNLEAYLGAISVNR